MVYTLLTLCVGVQLCAGRNPTNYGDPATGCEKDEQAVQVFGVQGDFCSPLCSSSGVSLRSFAGTRWPAVFLRVPLNLKFEMF